MAFEVLSAKIYTPYLGASIYVWTSILTVTLIGLAAGYWLGGRMSLKNARKGLTISLAGAAVFVLTSTFIASSVLPTLLSMNVKTAAIIAGFLILFLPVFLMGTVSPLIIGILNQLNSKLSAATGLIFGLGTVGGILFLLLDSDSRRWLIARWVDKFAQRSAVLEATTSPIITIAILGNIVNI